VQVLVLDEADRMLDMGFVHDVRMIVDMLPRKRQTLFFSATMSPRIASLASTMLTNPYSVSAAPPATVADNIDQRVMFVEKAHKRDLLAEILKHTNVERTLVFTRTKHGATRLARQLEQRGIKADAIHSNKTQGQRQRALADFAGGKLQVLVATDIVSRGIDVEGITHVVNYELPEDPENYVHRIGRTARAGAAGVALSLCDIEEVSLLRGIERLTRTPMTVTEDHGFHAPGVAACREAAVRAAKGRARAGGSRGSGSKWAR
jgi:ATP-dependent RNA helicase RhlE